MNKEQMSREAAAAEEPSQLARVNRIRALNDDLRETGRDGTIVITEGVVALGYEALAAVARAVVQFDAFSPENDPYGEHDCAVLTVDGVGVIWKINYFDHDLRGYSTDPADPEVTWRVLTIMLSGEY